jgi:hypothetical protein
MTTESESESELTYDWHYRQSVRHGNKPLENHKLCVLIS